MMNLNKRNWQFDTNHLVYTGNEDNKISFREQFYLKSKHTLKEFFELRFGAKLYEVGKGDPPQTSEFSKNKIYESKYKLDSTYIRLIRARNVKAYYVKDDEYYVKYGKNLAAQRDPNIFNGERILLQRIISGKKLDAAYINTNGICNTDIITLLPIDNKIDLFLFLGILCSKFCSYYIRSNNINLDRNAFPKINTNTLDNFPIPNYLTILNISDLTKSIIDSKKIDNQFDTSDLESQIDQLVYQLYDLTPEEIAIVEEAVK